MSGSTRPTGPPRGPLKRAVEWVLLDGDRLAVSGLVVAVAIAAVLAVGPLRQVTSSNATPLFYVFSAVLGGNLNLLTIVVSINQLVLTRELKSPGNYRQELESIGSLRDDVAAVTDADPAPTAPADFVRELVDATAETVATLREEARGARPADGGESGRGTSEDAFDALAADLSRTRERLDRDDVGSFDLVRAFTLVDSADAYRRTQKRLADPEDVSEAEREALERLADQLEALDVTQEHTKQLFTRENLSNMSRVLLYVGVPVEILAAATLIRFVGLYPAGAGAAFSPWVVYPIAALGLAPLAITFAFVVRAATVANRTATALQFSSQ